MLSYYKIFNNLDIQSIKEIDFSDIKNNYKNDFERFIYENNLNARDAWSYLIIKYANKNLDFVNSDHELDVGKNKDKTNINFL